MKKILLRSLRSLRFNTRMETPEKAESGNGATSPRRTSLPQLARVIADGKLRKDLRYQRNQLTRAGDAEGAAAITALLNDAQARRGGEEIPFTVMISPETFFGLKKLKQWGAFDSLPGMAEEILQEAIRAELRSRIAEGRDVPQTLAVSFLVQGLKSKV